MRPVTHPPLRHCPHCEIGWSIAIGDVCPDCGRTGALGPVGILLNTVERVS